MSEPDALVELLENELVIEDDVLLCSFIIATKRIEVIANFARQGPVLHLTKLHLQGAAVNQVGRAALWQAAYQLGRYFGVHTLHIAGGRRTTGRYRGQLLTPFTISIPTR